MGSDGPLATLAGARDALRRLKAQGPLKGPVSVNVAAGTYPLGERWSSSRRTAARPRRPSSTRRRRRPAVYRRAKNPRLSPAAGAAAGRSICPRCGRVSGTSRTSTSTAGALRPIAQRVLLLHSQGGGTGINPATGKRELLPRRAFVADPKDVAPLAGLASIA